MQLSPRPGIVQGGSGSPASHPCSLDREALLETRMDIQFCDLCNESVPEGDLETGRAYFRKGRLICRDCDHAMGGADAGAGGAGVPDTLPDDLSGGAARARTAAPPGNVPAGAPVRAGGGGAGGVVLGLLAIAFSGTAAWLLVERIDGLEATNNAGRLALASALENLQDDQRALEAGLAERFEAADRRAADRDAEGAAETIARLEELRDELAGFAEREEAVAGALDALDQRLVASETAADERVAPLSAQLARFEEDVLLFKDRLIDLEENLRLLSAGGPFVSPAVPLPVGSNPGAAPGRVLAGDEGAKPWAPLLADLQSDNAGIRLDAVYSLGETGDPGVVPHLVPMLKDEDLFVRMATARMLEDLQARLAVPALIDALEDEQSAVREAAVVALRKLTDEDFGFEPVASPADRGKRVKQWRDWWKKHGEEFLAGS